MINKLVGRIRYIRGTLSSVFMDRPSLKNGSRAAVQLVSDGYVVLPLLKEDDLTLLDQIMAGKFAAEDVANTGQLKGRVWSQGLLDARLPPVIEPARNIAAEVLRMPSPTIELSYFQLSDPVQEASDIPGGTFHLDDSMANIKWFVYLSDVKHDNGPFVAVGKTQGFRRLKKFMRALCWAFSAKRWCLYTQDRNKALDNNATRFTGARGFNFMVDTTAWHKADPVMHGQRVVFVASFNRGMVNA